MDYQSKLDIRQTEIAIKEIKDFFERSLAKNLNLTRVSAPLYVESTTGLNDNLNGQERPVTFDIPGADGVHVEIVHSLAKWKRQALKRYGFEEGEGLYTDMNAIRRDEELGPLHSIYVDQWDWEKVINKTQRTSETLKETVEKIYHSFKETQKYVTNLYPSLTNELPEEIHFITTEELLQMYPNNTPKEREDLICEKHKAVFLMQVGGELSNGEAHDGRAPDYDDWTLNGDILLWYAPLNRAIEFSSMGIRVCEHSLIKQLNVRNAADRAELPFHQQLLNGELPYTIGGGIGQSRICLFFLNKIHIGEVQASVWSEEIRSECAERNIELL